MEHEGHLSAGGGAIAQLMKLSAEQLREKYVATGLVTESDIEQYCRLADDPDSWAIYYATVAVTGWWQPQCGGRTWKDRHAIHCRVMGPAKARKKDVDNARVLGELIARREWVVLTGGRDVGVAGRGLSGRQKVPGSLTIGVLPSARERVSKYVDLAIITEMGNARNNVNVMSSNVVVVCGLMGTGTVSEVALALKAGKPVILVGGHADRRKFFKSWADA